MVMTYGLILTTATNTGIMSSIFIPMIIETMENDEEMSELTKDEKTSRALLCMLGQGVGAIIGSVLGGRTVDKYPKKVVCIVNALVLTVAYGFMFLYGSLYEFNYFLAIAMTFTFGT